MALLFPAPSERVYNQCDVYGFVPCRRGAVEINTPSSSTAAYLQRPLRGNDVGAHEHQQPMIMLMMMRTMLEMQLLAQARRPRYGIYCVAVSRA